MCKFDFYNMVNREQSGNMKERMTPEEVRDAGLTVYNAAEMDFKTAPSVMRAMMSCVENGLFGFSLNDETYADAVCWWMKNVRHTEIQSEWIVPTHGTIFSVATTIRMATKPGESIIIQPPVYNRYKQAADRLNRKVVYNNLKRNADGSYMMDFADLEEKMAQPENRLFILCNPQNPTGSVWEKESLTRIAKLAVKYGVIVFSDEIFADYTFGGNTAMPYCLTNDGSNNGISSISLGKTFNFTGVNHANMIIVDEVLRKRFIQQRDSDHYGSLDPLIRAAVLGAYCPEGAAWKAAAAALIEKNYRTVAAFLQEHLPEVIISPLQGGYVAWLDFGNMPMTESTLQYFFEKEALFVPSWGTDYCITDGKLARMNLTTTEKMLSRTLLKLESVLDGLKM